MIIFSSSKIDIMDIRDLVEDRCTFGEFGCYFKPLYGFPNKEATRCGYHREDGMVCLKADKRQKLCIGCKNATPSFNYKDQPKPLYCKQCANLSMVNVKILKGKKCNRCDDFISSIKEEFCQSCIELKLTNPDSEYHCETCKIGVAEFNYEGKVIPIRCEKCRLDGMIITNQRKRKRVDDQDLPSPKRVKVEMDVENKNTKREVKVIKLQSGVEVHIGINDATVVIKNGLKLTIVQEDGSVFSKNNIDDRFIRLVPQVSTPSIHQNSTPSAHQVLAPSTIRVPVAINEHTNYVQDSYQSELALARLTKVIKIEEEH